jgi:hypothetical protein
MRSRFVLLVVALVLFSSGCGLMKTAMHNLAVEMWENRDEHKDESRKPACLNSLKDGPEIPGGRPAIAPSSPYGAQ